MASEVDADGEIFSPPCEDIQDEVSVGSPTECDPGLGPKGIAVQHQVSVENPEDGVAEAGSQQFESQCGDAVEMVAGKVAVPFSGGSRMQGRAISDYISEFGSENRGECGSAEGAAAGSIDEPDKAEDATHCNQVSAAIRTQCGADSSSPHAKVQCDLVAEHGLEKTSSVVEPPGSSGLVETSGKFGPNDLNDNEFAEVSTPSSATNQSEENRDVKTMVKSVLNFGSDALVCAVCLDEIREGEKRSRAGRQTGCKHVFHWECIKQWFKVKVVCPVCNTLLYDHGIFEVDPLTGKEKYHRIRPEGVHGSLHAAAAEGNGSEVQRLIASGASVNGTTVGNVTPLHIAAHHGHSDAISRLVAGGAVVNQRAQGGATPLYLAAQSHHADAVARLLAGGAEVNWATEGGGTPLHVASQAGHREAVAWLLAGSAEVNRAMVGGTTPLFLASQGGHTDIVVRLLAQGASANHVAQDGATPLHYAALHGHTDCVARLLVGGADVNQSTFEGGAPLHVAAQGGHTEAVAWLLAGKAEVNKEIAGGATPLFLAARGGHSEVIAWLLAKQAHVDISTNAGATPLYIASRSGHAEAVGRLVAGGAAVDRRGDNGLSTALHCAVLSGQTEVIGRLLRAGAEAKPLDACLSILLGNLRGARRIAMANGYTWRLWATGVGFFVGSFGAAASSATMCFTLAQTFRDSLFPMASVAV